MYKIIDNFLPTHLFNEIQDLVYSPSFPWNITETAIKSNEGILKNKEISFVNVLFGDNIANNPVYASVSTALKTMLQVHKEDIQEGIFRIRFALQLPLVNRKNKINKPHIDIPEPHKVGILYLNNSDGETILYNEEYNYKGYKNNDIEEHTKNMTFHERVKVMPKENRIVIFDGSIWHSSSIPTESTTRMVLNFNFR